MATISPYTLRADFVSDGPVSAADLNRRSKVISSQLPGALRAASLSPGVMPLWQPDETLPQNELVEDLAEAAEDALKVTVSGGNYTVSAGAATILHPSGALIYTQTSGLSIPEDDTNPAYIHLMLAIPVDPLSPGVADSATGDPPTLLISDQESEEGGLLLASRIDGVLADERRFSAVVLLALANLELKARLDALGAPVDPGGDGPTAAQFLALQERVAALETSQATQDALIASLQSDETGVAGPTELEQLADEVAINRAGLAEVNPTAIERGQISVITANAGKGQFDGPDYSPTTGSSDELSFNPVDGTFGA